MANADVLLDPADAPTLSLAVFKSPVSVQLVPFQDSVAPVLGGTFPPKAKADVLIPSPPKFCLAVFKSAVSVQLVPFHNSVFPVTGGMSPPKAKAAVVVPHPSKLFLA